MKAMGKKRAQAKQTVEGRGEIHDGLTTDTEAEYGDCQPMKSTEDPDQPLHTRGDGDMVCAGNGFMEAQQSQSTDLNLPAQQTARQRVPEPDMTPAMRGQANRMDLSRPEQSFLHDMADTMHNIQNTMQRLLDNKDGNSAGNNRSVQGMQSGNRQYRDCHVGRQRAPTSRTDRRAADMPTRRTDGRAADMTEISSDSETDSRSFEVNRRWPAQAQARHSFKVTGVKLPAFTGKEQWKVWINRFNAIAERRGWSEAEKLDELLPRLQGAAGDFVFSQLSRQVLNNYQELIQELHNRYRVVETSKTYQAQFSKRNQKQGESVEEYAAELKRLYDMAHGYRDPKTRQEDLLRRFLDGLHDDSARFHVEYVKDPDNIDEAVYHVVHFAETRTPYGEKRLKRPARRTSPWQPLEHITSESETDCDHSTPRKHSVNRVPNKAQKKKTDLSSQSKAGETKNETAKQTEVKANKAEEDVDKTVMQQLQERIKALEEELKNRPQRQHNSGNLAEAQLRPAGQDSRNRRCYNCGEIGHFARNCTLPKQSAAGTYQMFDRRQSGRNGFMYNKGNNSAQNRPAMPVYGPLN